MDKLLYIISRCNFFVGSCAFLLMCSVIFLQVIARYVFNNALPWPEELGRYLFLVCAWSSICLCVEKHAHLKVDIIPMLMPKSATVLAFINVVSTTFFFAISTWLVWEMLYRVWKMGTRALTMPLPMWLIWGCILLFCTFSFLSSLGQFFAAISFCKSGHTGSQAWK